MRAVCIGECMVEMRREGDLYARAFAGDACNVAVYLKRSFPELEVQFLTATGDDSMSRAMRAAWRDEGIDDSLAFTVPRGRPGLYLIELREGGEREFLYWRSASAARRWFELLEQDPLRARLADADLVYFSGISVAILEPVQQERAIAFLGKHANRARRLAFDPNFRAALWLDPERARRVLGLGMRTADIVLPSTEDIAAIYGVSEPREQLGLICGTGADEVAMSLGAGGCLVWNGRAPVTIPAAAAGVVDTTGAGDAFHGAYLAERLRGSPPDVAARAGVVVASRVVTWPGAIVPASVSHPKDTS
ncbi:MAG TPA: sugar kinase [Rhizomicrobium sp.]|nr:sugar kinase [Rhizomicrobium sp.]